MAKLRIYGAGMSGLLAAQMLRRHAPTIHEAQSALPDNHGALLRFRTNAVGEATNIPLQRITVQKAVLNQQGLLSNSATLAEGNAYSVKVSGAATPRSVLNLSPGERYVAGPEFLAHLGMGVDIRFESPMTEGTLAERSRTSDPIISTIPMPVLMRLVGYVPLPAFRWRSIASLRVQLLVPKVQLYQTIYYPGNHETYYRASITGDELIVEYVTNREEEFSTKEAMVTVAKVLWDFGLTNVAHGPIRFKHQQYGKLLPIIEEERKRFIVAMSDELAIYSLGRFATWRQILMDDVVRDVHHVEAFFTQRSDYARRTHWSTKNL